MKTGIVINTIGPNQETQELLESINNNSLIDDVVVFFEDKHENPAFVNCAVSHIISAWCYPGNVIATNFNSASKILKMPILGKRYYYIYNFEWLNHQAFKFEPLLSVIADKNIEIICRTEEHAKVIHNNFNREVSIFCDRLEANKLLELTK